ncbi:hypothetical protein K443DRAFT_107777 [Laccaria amethystina LaAM-08-1]|uniref:DUF6589 domain-containing protein n=1 Tax=Laccaria amethystina LaAM-08-1 TaxID=1095629 RepID=A0A0C9X483_9AGAR|nr:hypothetical protein K443DRAFT_107777 [Laccaria amethystina LaAM-08-1]
MFFLQSGVGDPNRTPGAQDPQNRVILISGDLLTIQHLRSLQTTRAEESTPWGRVQFMVVVMGLFHLKMACADAMWRIFIHNKAKEPGPNDLITHVGQIRPKETRKIETKPGFRRMHECIQHVGIVSRLEVWRLAAKDKFSGVATLEDFADLAPAWDVLQEMAAQIASRNPTPAKFSRMRARKVGERDQQLENMMLREAYFLLYEEISHGLNHGDIGRVESCFMPWALIFAGCGKHKYAAEMRRYLEDIHFVYPESLRRAIRMNILCNPTGKKGHFRPIDWVIEHNNLYIKRIYGGKFSNHTQERIMKESALIEVYKNIRIQFEQMFCLEHKTIRHSPPKMKNTFDKLGEYMQKESTHTEVIGRTAHNIIDAMAKGMHMAMTGHAPGGSGSSDSGELGDDAEEVDDDGSLDV